MGRVMGRVVDASTDGVAGGGCVEGGGSPLRKYVSMKLMPVYSFLTSTCAKVAGALAARDGGGSSGCLAAESGTAAESGRRDQSECVRRRRSSRSSRCALP